MKREELDIREYFRVLKRRRLAFGLSLAVVYAIILAATFTATPVYRATAQVYIDPRAYEQVEFTRSQYPADSSRYLQTQIGILKSQAVAEEVVSRLGLYMAEPQNRPSFSFSGLFGRHSGQPASDEARRGKAIQKFMDNLDVQPVKDSTLLKVSYEDKDPVLAAAAANAAVQAYIDKNLALTVNQSRKITGWLNEKVDEARDKMAGSSNRVQDFKSEKGIVSAGSNDISIQALSDLNTKVLAAESRRYEAETRYRQAAALSRDPDRAMSIPGVLDNPNLQALRVQQGVLAKQIAEMSGRYGEKHPQMARLKSQMRSLEKQIQGQMDLIVGTMKNDYENALRAEQSLKKALASQKAAAMDYERRSAEYDLRKQDSEGMRGIYESLLKSSKQTGIMGSISVSGAQVLDRAATPLSPDRPRKGKNIVLGLIVSLFAGAAAAFFLENIDNTCRSPEDVHRVLGLPLLGVVPTVKPRAGGMGPGAPETVSRPGSLGAAAYRNIMNRMLLAAGDTPPKVICVTSAEPSEGKSTLSCNLACALAAAGERALLIDCDMRRPKTHKILNVPNARGLSSLLAHRADLSGVITGAAVPGLSVIPAGPVAPDPCELLGSKTMKEAIGLLRARYDRIILDSPAFLGIADSSVLAALADGVILVVCSGETGRERMVRTAKAIAGLDGARMLGAVLNDRSRKSVEYYDVRNHGHYYPAGEGAVSGAGGLTLAAERDE